MKLNFSVLALLFFIGCTGNSNRATEAENRQAASEELNEMDVVGLLANADTYDGREVLLKGTVVHVCKHSGKRLHLMGADDKTRIRIEAGKIGQFGRELEGSTIVAKGIFRRQVIDEEYLAKWEGELKKEGGKHQKSRDGREEERGKMRRYREMMKERDGGQIEQYWIDGISFDPVDEEPAM
ncbi:MAG: hypothetical protein MI975_01865 [Cytophagales bacterium]|nr:hypothetical protein [Cytophagales bacterium]